MKPAVVWLSLLTAAGAVAQCTSPCPFISFEDARPILEAYSAQLPASLGDIRSLNAARWTAWLQAEDRVIRQRLEQGEEDTLSNLLRFGVTYTKEYRITDEYLPKFGQSSLVNAFAENRANDLIRALASPTASEGFQQMRAFVERRGQSLATPAGRAALKKYLLANLARLREDFLKAHEDARKNRANEFSERGISLDTNLWPDYDLDLQFRKMLAAGLITAGGVRRVAIVGPGLDFVNKQDGLDYYPPQTIQPFAVMDSLVRLGLSDAKSLQVVTLDISGNVNAHLERARARAEAGQPYVLQLPWLAAGRWSEDFRRSFVDYWQGLGSQLGVPAKAIPVPGGAEGVETRAVSVRPAMVGRITPVDLNIVFQRMPQQAERGFDLVIGTNIFLYYGEFEQSLARANVAALLRQGGVLISNDQLAEKVPAGLELAMTTKIPMTTEPVITESVFSYKRR
jgi:hypothetical protein